MSNFLSWQIDSGNPKKLLGFYKDLLGWKVDPASGHIQMFKTKSGESARGGIHELHDPKSRSILTMVLQVDDVQKHLDKAERLGRKVVEKAHLVSTNNTLARF